MRVSKPMTSFLEDQSLGNAEAGIRFVTLGTEITSVYRYQKQNLVGMSVGGLCCILFPL